MADRQITGILRHIRRLVRPEEPSGQTDGVLLHRFAASHDQAAFAALVERHGPMVLGLCRRVLKNAHDAEDAFQATFLVLVRKAPALRQWGSLGNWLYTVAYRLALKVKAGAARRRQQEGLVEDMLPAPDDGTTAWRELRAVLDAEMSHLPEQYRHPVVLCYLEGKTNEEAAVVLGWPTVTLKHRLARARELLRERLTQRGLAPTVDLLAPSLASQATAAVPIPLLEHTLKAAALFAVGAALADEVSKPAALAEGALHTMFVNKLKTTVALTVVAALGVAGGLVVWSYGAAADKPGKPPAAPATLPAESQVVRLAGTEWLHVVALSDDARFMAGAIANSDKGLRLWSVAAGKELYQLEIHRGNDYIDALAVSLDGKAIAAVSHPRIGQAQSQVGVGIVVPNGTPLPQDNRKPAPQIAEQPLEAIVVWDLATGKEFVRMPGHGGGRTLCFSPDGRTLAAGDVGGGVNLWDTATGKASRQLQGRAKDDAQYSEFDPGSLAFSPDGRLLASASSWNCLQAQDNTPGQLGNDRPPFALLVVWECATGKEVLRVREPRAQFGTLAFAPDSRTLAVQEKGYPGKVRFWDTSDRKETRAIRGAEARCLAFSSDGKCLVTADRWVIQVWDAVTGKQQRQFQARIDETNQNFVESRSQVQTLRFLPGGTVFCTASGSGLLQRWNMNDLPAHVPDEKLRRLGAPPSVIQGP